MHAAAETYRKGRSSKLQVQAVVEQGKATQSEMLAATLTKSGQLSKDPATGRQQNVAPSLS